MRIHRLPSSTLSTSLPPLGKLSANPFEPDSTSNQFGRYGSPFSPDSLNNQFGAGNPFRPDSPNNPYGKGWRIEGGT